MGTCDQIMQLVELHLQWRWPYTLAMSVGHAEVLCVLYIEFGLDVWFSFLSAAIVLSCRLYSGSSRNDVRFPRCLHTHAEKMPVAIL